MCFFLNRVEFCQKKIGSVISDLMATKCIYSGTFDEQSFFTSVLMLAHSVLLIMGKGGGVTAKLLILGRGGVIELEPKV